MREVFSELTMKTPERQRRRFVVFIINFERISHILMFLLWNLNK